ncbi:MAG TPA: hypothetical protein VFE37_25900 [Chloroflexota bacterium]|nr:hypothetical protein [Chloroflexota bacterium]
MDDSEAEARAQRERLEAAEIFAFIFPVLDRLLLLDVRSLPTHAPQALVVSSAEIVQDFVPRFRRQLSDLFLRRPELIFSRLRLFSYLDGEMAQLVVEAALAREQRPPVERGAERSFAYARVRTATAEFFATSVWQLVEETAQRKSQHTLGDSLATAREQLATWEQELVRRAAAEERRRLFSERHYRIIRPQEPPDS